MTVDRRSVPSIVLGAIACLAAVGAVFPPRPHVGHAQSLASFDAVAAADGIRYRVDAPGATAVNTLVDIGLPSSQALVNGLGASRAFAAYPYPGDAALTLPGTGAGMAGLPSPPAYPLIVESSHPTRPDDSHEEPSFSLDATSTETGSRGEAVSGMQAEQFSIGRMLAVAETTRDPDTGRLVAEARTLVEAVEIAGVVRVQRIEAVARAAKDADAPDAVSASDVTVEGATVAGIPVTLTPQGVVVGDSPTGVGLRDRSSVDTVLEGAGVRLRLVEGSATPDGVVAGAIEVQIEQTAPGGQPTSQVLIVGGVRAHVGSTIAATPAGAQGGGWLHQASGGPPQAEVESGGTAGGPGAPGAGFGVSPGEPAHGAAASSAPDPGRGIVSRVLPDTGGFYAALAVSALVALLALQLIRRIGVTQTWSS